MAKQAKRKTRAEKEAGVAGAIEAIDRVLSFLSAESSLIVGASYDSDTSDCRIEFMSGKTYAYALPGELWDAFVLSTSKGQFFNRSIRPFYVGREVTL